MFHIDTQDWRFTPDGDPRGYIQPQSLKELWFHTGTLCNLRCPFCLEKEKGIAAPWYIITSLMT